MVSYLRFVPASTANILINWSRVPEESKKVLNRWIYPGDPLPTTVADLAKTWDGYKFCGYFDTNLCTLIMDISEFGLQMAPEQVGPRFYMEYDGQINFVLFTPGSRDCILGHKDIYKRQAAKMVAQMFDVKLEQDVLRGMVPFVNINKRLGGWEASMVKVIHSPWRYS